MDMTVSPHPVTPDAFNYYVVDRLGALCTAAQHCCGRTVDV